MGDFAPRGTFTALVTPFSEDGTAVDWAAYERLVENQLSAGLEGLVPVGTTGESPTLSDEEQGELIRRTVALTKGRASVLAGVGSNNTAKVKKLVRVAADAGAAAVMVVMPYYNKPDQRGLVEHVIASAGASPLPVVIYNVPGRTSVALKVETTLRLLESCPQVVAVKDASNNVHYCQRLLNQAGDRVTVLSGDDALTLPLMSVGAQGVISVTSNIEPQAVKGVVDAVHSGEWEAARKRHLALLELHDAMFRAPSPVPVKAVLAARGMMNKTVRLPLVDAEPELEQRILDAARAFGG